MTRLKIDKEKLMQWFLEESNGNSKLRDDVGNTLYTAIKEGIYQKRQLIINIITLAGAIIGVGLTISDKIDFNLLLTSVFLYILLSATGIYTIVSGIEGDIAGHKKQLDLYNKIIDSKRDAALKVVYEETEEAMKEYTENNQRILKELEDGKPKKEGRDISLYLVLLLFLLILIIFLLAIAKGKGIHVPFQHIYQKNYIAEFFQFYF